MKNGIGIICRVVKSLRPSFLDDRIIVLFLLLVSFGTYGNALANPFISDDISIIRSVPTQRLLVTDPHLLRTLLYEITYQIFGLAPIAFRTISILFHFGSAAVLFFLLKKIIGRGEALICTLLFVVHPMTVEPVVWISGGIYIQYGFFLLLSMYLYFNRKRRCYFPILSVLSFVAALYTSEKAVFFPVVLLMYEVVRSTLKKNVKAMVPFVIAAAIYIVLNAFLFQSRVMDLSAVAGGIPKWENPFIYFPSALSLYLRYLIWPDRLSLYHPDPAVTIGLLVMAYTVCIAYVVSLLYIWRTDKILFFWFLMIFVFLSPVLLPYRITWIIAERYAYLATAAFCVCIGIVIERITRKKRIVGTVIFLLFFTGYTVRTHYRNTDWRSEEVFWKATVLAEPTEPKAHNTLASVYVTQNKYDDAIHELSLAIVSNPKYLPAYFNLGLIYETLGVATKAGELYAKVLELNPANTEAVQALWRVSQKK